MTLSQKLKTILSSYNSTYDAAQKISLQTKESLDTVHHRLSKWMKKDPETWVKINQTLRLLGYRVEIRKMNDLKNVLPLEKYGHGQAKSFQSLLNEIKSGESQIIWEDSKPIRCLKVARVKVICLDRELTLYEDHQEFTDGRIRKRGFDKLSEKMTIDEEPAIAAERALREELGMSNAALKLTPIHLDGIDHDELESPSYPGLLTRYEFHDFLAYFPVEYWQEEFREVQADKTTVFVWR
jgi:hypothetical protein